MQARTGGAKQLQPPAFSAKRLEENAHAMLQFIKEQCRGDGDAYWLFKGSGGESVVRMYQLTSEHHVSVGTPEAQWKWQYTLAMLCYRVALKLSRHNDGSEHDSRRRCDLLAKCTSLLQTIAETDGPKRIQLRRVIHEELAESLRHSISASAPQSVVSSSPAPSPKEVTLRATQRLRFAVHNWQAAVMLSDPGEQQEALIRARRGILSCFMQCARVQLCAGFLKRALACVQQGLEECFVCALEGARTDYIPFAKDLKTLFAASQNLLPAPRLAAEAFILHGDILLQIGKSGATSNEIDSGGITTKQGVASIESAVDTLLRRVSAQQASDQKARTVDGSIRSIFEYSLSPTLAEHTPSRPLVYVERLVIWARAHTSKRCSSQLAYHHFAGEKRAGKLATRSTSLVSFVCTRAASQRLLRSLSRASFALSPPTTRQTLHCSPAIWHTPSDLLQRRSSAGRRTSRRLLLYSKKHLRG